MRRLILVRHSESRPTPDIPPARWPLTAVGRERCRHLARALEPFGPETVITSTEEKAAETGAILAELWGVGCSTFAGLHEHERTGEPFERSQLRFEQRMAGFFQQPDRRVYGRESATACLERFSGAVEQALAEHPGVTPVMVTHGSVMSLYIAARAGADPFAIWRRLEMPAFAVFTLPACRLVEIRYRVTSSAAGAP